MRISSCFQACLLFQVNRYICLSSISFHTAEFKPQKFLSLVMNIDDVAYIWLFYFQEILSNAEFYTSSL